MRFEAYSGSPASQRGDCLIVGVFDDRQLGETGTAVDRALRGPLRRLLDRGDFSGRAGESLLVTELRGVTRSALLVGLGPRATYQRRAWRRALSTAITALSRTRIASAVLALERPSARDFDDELFARSCAELGAGGLYRINALKSGRKPRANALTRLRVGPFAKAQLALARRALADGAALAASATLLRDLANMPGNVCTPRYLANAAVA